MNSVCKQIQEGETRRNKNKQLHTVVTVHINILRINLDFGFLYHPQVNCFFGRKKKCLLIQSFRQSDR